MTPAIRGPQAVTPQMAPVSAQTMEKVLMQGDLEQLQPHERVQYYKSVCDSLGLNPLTRPFEYLRFQGKLQLYARKDCTEQLRNMHNISVRIVSREVQDGCYIVTARATMPSGREDESIGAVAIEGLKGEARSNAVMKAETKSKRRVTLSICGLAFLDESEEASVAGAQRVPVDAETGEIPEPKAGPDLETDVRNNPPKEPKKAQDKSKWQIDMLQAFGAVKKRYQALGMEMKYYARLAEFGKKKSSEFTHEERQQALACHKIMSLEVQELEVLATRVADAAECDSLPDPRNLPLGRKMRYQGITYEVTETRNGNDWREVD